MIYRKNVGPVERWGRLAAGGVLGAVGLAVAWSTPFGLGLAAAGAGLALTGVFGFCPACALVGRRGPH